MKKLFIIVLLFSFQFNSFGQNEYQQLLAKIKKDKIALKQNKASNDSIKSYLLDQFENKIFPHWVGRPWDYNGYTNTPYKGDIACGYFVSTTLKHMGFNWNRYELAKMYSKQIVEDVCDTSYVFDNLLKLRRHLLFQDDNLFIIGLSSHVGLILKRGDKLYFIHSNYYDLKGPDKEILSDSPAIHDSDVFWCGKFLTDSNIKKWLNNTPYNLVRKKL